MLRAGSGQALCCACPFLTAALALLAFGGMHDARATQVLPTFDVVRRWADMVCTEFSTQVAKERENGIPVSAFMDNLDTVAAVAKLQVGFAKFVVRPLWLVAGNHFQELGERVKQLDRNVNQWDRIHKNAGSPVHM
jgi:hypothetical protein